MFIVAASNVSALRTHKAEVTEAHVKAGLKKLVEDGKAEPLFAQLPGLENGLRQKWPDLFSAAAQKPETVSPFAAPVRGLVFDMGRRRLGFVTGDGQTRDFGVEIKGSLIQGLSKADTVTFFEVERESGTMRTGFSALLTCKTENP